MYSTRVYRKTMSGVTYQMSLKKLNFHLLIIVNKQKTGRAIVSDFSFVLFFEGKK